MTSTKHEREIQRLNAKIATLYYALDDIKTICAGNGLYSDSDLKDCKQAVTSIAGIVNRANTQTRRREPGVNHD